MPDDKKLSRRALLTFWRRPVPDKVPKVPPPPAPVSPSGIPWPVDRSPGPALGRRLPLRPPGNMQEYILREACTRCNKCEEVCPADAIYMLDDSWGEARGTPAIDPRKSPCVVCDGFKCTQVCPSGALQPVYNIAEIKMGAAVVETTRCSTYLGQACDACITVCPVPGALFPDPSGHPFVDEYKCIGCGLCVRACPTEPGSMTVVPRD